MSLIPDAMTKQWQDPDGRFAPVLLPIVTADNLRLIRVALKTEATPTLEILLEPTDAQALTIERISTISRQMSAALDVADTIPGKYTLDVGSAGGERPLTCDADFTRFTGFTVKVKLKEKLETGRGKIKGTLTAFNADGLTITDETPITLPIPLLQDVRIVADEYYFERIKQGTFPKHIGA